MQCGGKIGGGNSGENSGGVHSGVSGPPRGGSRLFEERVANLTCQNDIT